jgi:universal stress protein E
MFAPRRILVAVKDPRSRSLPAVTKAAQLAQAFDAELELFHGILDPISADPRLYSGDQVLQLQHNIRTGHLEALARIAARLRRKGLTVNVSAEWDFPVYEAIVRRARNVKADLIVGECHAGRRIAPWLLHVTDWELLRTSPLPVLLVKNTHAWRRPVVLAALDPTHAHAKPARLDDAIIRTASSVAKALHGSMHAMHAYTAVPPSAVSFAATSTQLMTKILDDSEKLARASFDKALASSSTKLPRNRRHLARDVPIEAIPRTARKVRSNIVVMGAVSRSGLKRALIGNTAERVLAELTCDVLVVKAPGFATRVPRTKRGVRYVFPPRLLTPY